MYNVRGQTEIVIIIEIFKAIVFLLLRFNYIGTYLKIHNLIDILIVVALHLLRQNYVKSETVMDSLIFLLLYFCLKLYYRRVNYFLVWQAVAIYRSRVSVSICLEFLKINFRLYIRIKRNT